MTTEKPSLWNRFREVTVAGVLIVVCSVLGWRLLAGPGPTRPAIPVDPVDIGGAQLEGQATAGAVIIIFSDFQCPYCGVFARDTLPKVRRDFVESGKLMLAFEHYPLTTIHRYAMRAAEAAECAGRSGRFWPMHDRLFALNGKFNDDTFSKTAQQLGLATEEFDDCLKTGLSPKVKTSLEQGKSLGVTGTPTFFIGRRTTDDRVKVSRRFDGIVSFEVLSAALTDASANR